MTGPRIVTNDPDLGKRIEEASKILGTDWYNNHAVGLANHTARQMHERFTNLESQYTPAFLRSYKFTAGQEDSRDHQIVYLPSTMNDLNKAIGVASDDLIENSHMLANLDRINNFQHRAEMARAFTMWQRSHAGKLPEPLALVHYDAYVNHGPRAMGMLAASGGDPNRYIDIRDQFYANIPERSSEGGPITNPGWRNRRIPALRQAVANMTSNRSD